MALPASWPPRHPSGRASIRFYQEGTTTALFADNAYMFGEQTTANPFKATPYVKPGQETPVAYGTINSGGQTPRGAGRAPEDTSQFFPAADQRVPIPHLWPNTILVANGGATPIEISFDGTNVHGKIKSGEVRIYRNRMESGISVREPGAGAIAFSVEAW